MAKALLTTNRMNPSRGALVAAMSGFAVMALELTAVRLLAPYFGDSAYVWTNVIGVMLVALALGAFLGGRMADASGARRLFWLLFLAGMAVATIPLLAKPLGQWLLPADLPLDAAMPALVRGSFVATSLLFVPPILLLGCVTPMLVRLLAVEQHLVGRASGLVSAMSTLGSLLGTFAATHALIPYLGSRMTVWLCSSLLVLAALMCRWQPKVLLALLPPMLLAWLYTGAGPLRDPLPGQTLLAESESRYQYLQVVQYQEGAEQLTSLKINEGLDSFHSVAVQGQAFTNGRYYDYHAVTPFLAGDGQRPDSLKVLSLGDAAGTFSRVFQHAHPGCIVDGVEIDPEVIALGQTIFAGQRAKGAMYPMDARVFVNRCRQQYDVVLVDAYEHQIYIPAHLASADFFAAVKKVLQVGGVVSLNCGGFSLQDPVLQSLAQTMAKVFGSSHVFRVPGARNFVLAARRDKALQPERLAQVSTDDADLRKILAATSQPGVWQEILPGNRILDDDRPLLDSLQERTYAGPAKEADLIVMQGTRKSAEVGDEVHALLTRNRFAEALQVLPQADAATAYLRLLAGDCFFHIHQLAAALQEYGAAKLLDDGSYAQVLKARMNSARLEWAQQERATEVASRNLWLAVLTSVTLLVLFFILGRRHFLPKPT